VDDLSFVKTLLYLLLGIGFVPAILITSRSVLYRMRPRVHRPIVFLLFGAFFAVAGLVCTFLAFSAVHSGVVHCALRVCTSSYSLDQPVFYWTFVAMWYLGGVVITGTGVAGIRKAFHRP
jgi:hypothetical protein